ncbi:hypothetical protein HaLaN_08445 [Haematococcus lacustris]|uniref:Uncharacterized protein n=1 Tax=Haematococcus lacustris TaxID=44745 RepID=A0A699YZ63_HAELA|nr:hypothetical protein HaLaN_08445 [Haematococcus lacustris]
MGICASRGHVLARAEAFDASAGGWGSCSVTGPRTGIIGSAKEAQSKTPPSILTRSNTLAVVLIIAHSAQDAHVAVDTLRLHLADVQVTDPNAPGRQKRQRGLIARMSNMWSRNHRNRVLTSEGSKPTAGVKQGVKHSHMKTRLGFPCCTAQLTKCASQLGDVAHATEPGATCKRSATVHTSARSTTATVQARGVMLVQLPPDAAAAFPAWSGCLHAVSLAMTSWQPPEEGAAPVPAILLQHAPCPGGCWLPRTPCTAHWPPGGWPEWPSAAPGVHPGCAAQPGHAVHSGGPAGSSSPQEVCSPQAAPSALETTIEEAAEEEDWEWAERRARSAVGPADAEEQSPGSQPGVAEYPTSLHDVTITAMVDPESGQQVG